MNVGFPPVAPLLVLATYALVFGYLAKRFFRWEQGKPACQASRVTVCQAPITDHPTIHPTMMVIMAQVGMGSVRRPAASGSGAARS